MYVGPVEGLPAGLRALLFDREAVIRAAERAVVPIIEAVRREGDLALLRLTKEFDGVELQATDLALDPRGLADPTPELPKMVLAATETAMTRVIAYHRRQWSVRQLEADGATGRWTVPVDSVGHYVPGGRAAYPSSAIMTLAPSLVAGVRERHLCTPPTASGRVHPLTLWVARRMGVTSLHLVGGAQAIAAMALGTPSVARVDRIVGPGNAYVVAAKRALRHEVESDSYSGPSELLVIADHSATPHAAAIAADLIAQAEHDPAASVVLLTDSEAVLDSVTAQVREQLADLPQGKTASAAMASGGALLLLPDLPSMVAWAERFAPEHLSLLVAAPEHVLPQLRHAGAIFVGPESAVALGDYVAGPNHVLPTGGAAARHSGLSVDSVSRSFCVVRIDAATLSQLGPVAVTLARLEGLEGHARSLEVRLQSVPEPRR